MSNFEFLNHKQFPNKYQICKNTNLLKYKLASSRIYSDSYFNEEYKLQYKKTYYEDEINLRNLAKNRLNILESFLPGTNLNLLEIGCACGFFLDEAKKRGFHTFGLELSKTEVEYAKKNHLNVVQSDFLSYDFKDTFDVVAAFFVLEHIENINLAFEKLTSLIRKNGFLFLATPSTNGPSFKTNIKDWFEHHPKDHFFDYSPNSLKKVLNLYNFEIVYKKPMSYHKKRDKSWKGKLNEYFYKLYADLFCYGDTMQVVAKKI